MRLLEKRTHLEDVPPVRALGSARLIGIGRFVSAVSLFIASQVSANTPSAATSVASGISVGDVIKLQVAEEILIGRCMKSKGFEYWSTAVEAENPINRFPFVITNYRWAERFGFGNALVKSSAQYLNQTYFDHLTNRNKQRYTRDFNGPSAGPTVAVSLPTGAVVGHSSEGCNAEADKILYGRYSAWFKEENLYQDLMSDIDLQVLESSSYQLAVAKWSMCMRTRNYSYASPGLAMRHFLAASITENSVAVKVAESEVRCAQETHLSVISEQIERQEINDLPSKYQKSIEETIKSERSA
jgi:hypothetical protein